MRVVALLGGSRIAVGCASLVLLATLFRQGSVAGAETPPDPAMARFDEAILRDPTNPQLYIARAIARNAKGAFDLAMDDFAEAIRLNPKDISAYQQRALAWEGKQEFDKANEDYKMAIELDPNSSMSFNYRGNSRRNKKEFDAAIAEYTKAIELDANNAYAYGNRGSAWRVKGSLDKAIDDFGEAIRLAPTHPVPYQNRALAWHAKKDFDAAIADHTRAIELDPNSAYSYNSRGLTWHAKGNMDKAIDDFREAIRLNPKDETYLIQLADVLGQDKQFQVQQNLLTDYIAREPKTLDAREALARCFFIQEKHEEALAVYKQLDALRPKHPTTLALIAQELSMLKRGSESVDYYRQALAAVPKVDNQSLSWLWANNLAWIQATSADPALRNGPEAVRWAQQACDAVDLKHPQYVVLIDTLACAYAENGQFDKAIERAKQFVQGLKDTKASVQAIQAAEERLKLFESGRPYRDE